MAGEPLKTLIHRVTVARATVAGQKAALDASRQAWEAANAEAMQTLRTNVESLQEAEVTLKAALAAYVETGLKKPAQGVGIREVTKLVYEPADALAWAMEHGLALQLDTRAFERIAKSTPLPFVAERTEYVATIATDLASAVMTEDA